MHMENMLSLTCVALGVLLPLSVVGMTPYEEPTDPCYAEHEAAYPASGRVDNWASWSRDQDITNCIRRFDQRVREVTNKQRPARKRRGGLPSHEILENVLQYSNWTSLCSTGFNVTECLGAARNECSSTFAPWYFREGEIFLRGYSEELYIDVFRSFYDRTCEGPNVKASLMKILTDAPSTGCVSTRTLSENCIDAIYDQLLGGQIKNLYMPAEQEWWKAVSTSSLRCAADVIRARNCSVVQQELLYHGVKLAQPWTINVDELDPNSGTTIDLASLRRCTVGVYGDPHMRLCDMPRQITCSSPGRRTYLENSYMRITGTNTLISSSSGSRATTLTDVQVVFYSLSGGSSTGSYEASNSRIPSFFVGSENLTSIGSGDDNVTIETLHPDSRVVLYHGKLGLVLTIRRWRNNYFFTLRASNQFIESSYGLLVTGCAISDRLDISQTGPSRRRRGLNLVDCQNACINTTTMYDYCVYDCRQTNIVDIAEMSVEAEKMEMEVVQDDQRLINTAIVVQKPSIGLNPVSVATRSTLASVAGLFALFALLL